MSKIVSWGMENLKNFWGMASSPLFLLSRVNLGTELPLWQSLPCKVHDPSRPRNTPSFKINYCNISFKLGKIHKLWCKEILSKIRKCWAVEKEIIILRVEALVHPSQDGRDYFAGLSVTKRNTAMVLLTLTLLQTPTLTLTLILTLTLT
jgi:hypothetical protein